MTGKKRKACER